MREMKDSGIAWIGKIPVDWKVCRVKFLADNNHLYPIGDGDHGMIKSSDYLDEGIPYIRVLNLTWCNGLNLDNLVFISEEMNRRIKNSELKPNDILVAKTGATIGKTAIVPISLPISNTTSHVGKISIAPIHSAKYFYYVMSSFIVQKQIRDISAMQSTRPELGIEGLKNLILIVPSYKEQKQISYFLDAKCAEIDALSSDIQTQIDTLEQYKRSVISEAVTKGLDPNVPMKDSGIAWVKQIPKHWSVIPSKYLFHNSDTRKYPGDEQLTASQRHGIITQREYMERENAKVVFATQGLDNWKHVKPNDFVISLRSFQGGLEMSETTGCITWHYVVLEASKPIYPPFYKWLFKSVQYINALQGTCNFIRDGQDLRFSNFSKVPLYEPPMVEQKAIADYLDAKCAEIDQTIAQKQEQLATLADYKKSLIYEYVTGKEEVPGL